MKELSTKEKYNCKSMENKHNERDDEESKSLVEDTHGKGRERKIRMNDGEVDDPCSFMNGTLFLWLSWH